MSKRTIRHKNKKRDKKNKTHKYTIKRSHDKMMSNLFGGASEYQILNKTILPRLSFPLDVYKKNGENFEHIITITSFDNINGTIEANNINSGRSVPNFLDNPGRQNQYYYDVNQNQPNSIDTAEIDNNDDVSVASTINTDTNPLTPSSSVDATGSSVDATGSSVDATGSSVDATGSSVQTNFLTKLKANMYSPLKNIVSLSDPNRLPMKVYKQNGSNYEEFGIITEYKSPDLTILNITTKEYDIVPVTTLEDLDNLQLFTKKRDTKEMAQEELDNFSKGTREETIGTGVEVPLEPSGPASDSSSGFVSSPDAGSGPKSAPDIDPAQFKQLLTNLSVKLNTSLLAMLNAYKTTLSTLAENETDETKKATINQLIDHIDGEINTMKESGNTIKDKYADELSADPDIEIDKQLKNLLSVDTYGALLGALAAMGIVMLGGKGKKRKTKGRKYKGKSSKNTRRTKNKKNKTK